jgi:hypothetical protein
MDGKGMTTESTLALCPSCQDFYGDRAPSTGEGRCDTCGCQAYVAVTTPARIAKVIKHMTHSRNTTLRCIWLWLRIVGRESWADQRMGPVLAWQIARCIHPRHVPTVCPRPSPRVDGETC